MKYPKPALTFTAQADQLLQRGLVAPNRQAVVEKLQTVSYYRLSAYWYPFRQPDDTLKPGTSLETVWRRYTFDRQLRLLVLDAIARLFGLLTVLHYLLKQVAPRSQWRVRWEHLLALYPEIPIADMGFPTNWKDSPLWQ